MLLPSPMLLSLCEKRCVCLPIFYLLQSGHMIPQLPCVSKWLLQGRGGNTDNGLWEPMGDIMDDRVPSHCLALPKPGAGGLCKQTRAA